MAVTSLGLARISLTSANADLLASFYENGLGFVQTGRVRVDATGYGMADTEALVVTLALGEQLIELVQFDQPGLPYPTTNTSYDPWFQHIAIVVTDIAAALLRLSQQAQPILISQNGPVTMPAATGVITAVKLRDPEMHPFELLQYPAGGIPSQWDGLVPENGFAIGIDHFGMVVSNPTNSIAFYAGLGLAVSSSFLSQGAEQQSLDAAAGAVVEVIGMSPSQATPHVNLLCYSTPVAAAAIAIAANDIAATRLVLRVDGPPATQGPLIDPDGHRLLLVGVRGWGYPDGGLT